MKVLKVTIKSTSVTSEVNIPRERKVALSNRCFPVLVGEEQAVIERGFAREGFTPNHCAHFLCPRSFKIGHNLAYLGSNC